jgi:uncharacterized repeat protein (TIGR01451 family)
MKVKIMKNSRLKIFLMLTVAIFFAQQANAQIPPFHGISFLKGAESPVTVGNPYYAAYIISNTVDTAHDTLIVSALVDTVHASGGDVISPNILTTLNWTLSGGAHFVGSDLILPFGGSAMSDLYSFYTTVPGDFFLSGHVLVDTALLTWHDTCDGTSTNCNTQNRNTDTVSQADVNAPLPKVKATKAADCDVVTVGKLVTYTISLQNTGPNPLTLVSINDTLLGNITAQAQANCGTLAVGASCSFNVTRTIQPSDISPLKNTVTATYVDAFAQQTSSVADATVTIIHPDYTVVKTCTSKPIPDGGPATFNVAVHNTGDVSLKFTTNEAPPLSNVAEPFTVAVGQTQNLTITVPTSGSDVNNTITVTGNVTDTLVCPIPNIVKSANAICFAKPSVEVSKTVACDVSMPGSVVTYKITITNKGADTLNLVSVVDSLLGNLTSLVAAHGCSVLAGGQSCTVDVNRVVLQGDPSTLVNTVTVNYVDSQQQPATDNNSVSVKIIHPSYTVLKTCNIDPIPADSNTASFNVAIHNTGDVNLVFVTDEEAQSSLDEPFIVAPGITQNLTITLPFTGTDVANTITVTGNLADEVCLKIPNIEKTSGATCHAPTGGATRTPGFWQTHTAFSKCIFDKCGSHFDLGWVQIDNYADLFGIFWASSAKNTNGLNRDPLCKARELASFQALAALLNGCLGNGKPLPVSPTNIASILGGTNIAAIQKLQSQLGAYNSSGDLVGIVDGCPIGNATPQLSKFIANLKAADCGSVTTTSYNHRDRR